MIPGATINGHRFEEFGCYLTKRKVDLVPVTRDIEVTIPGRPGVYDFRTEHSKRQLTLSLSFVADSREALQANLRAFARAVDPTQGYIPLIFDDEPDKVYRVKVTQEIATTYLPTIAQFDLMLKMADPFIYAAQPTSVTQTLEPGDHMVVTNAGTAGTGMLISISPVADGTIVNPSITVGAVTVTWTGSIASGQTLHIDTEGYTIDLSGVNAMAGWTGDWPQLAPGDNTLIFQAGVGSSAAQLTVSFTARFV